MKRRATMLFLVAAVACLQAAASAAQAKRPVAAPRKAQTVPFAVGETLTYDVSWSSYLTAATATMTVKERKPSYGSDAYYVVAEGRPTALVSTLYDLYYKVDSLLDVYTLLPQRASIFSQEGKRKRNKITMFNHKGRKAHYEIQTATVVKKDLAISPHAQDVLGALYVIRAIPFKAGEKFSIPICDDGESYTVQVSVGAVETVKTGIGDVRAYKLTPALPTTHAQSARRVTVWLSDDGRKLPVRMQAQLAVGTFDLTLTSATR